MGPDSFSLQVFARKKNESAFRTMKQMVNYRLVVRLCDQRCAQLFRRVVHGTLTLQLGPQPQDATTTHVIRCEKKLTMSTQITPSWILINIFSSIHSALKYFLKDSL